jgi:hypothetical protein
MTKPTSSYLCIRCGYNTPYKCNLMKHLNRKNICKSKLKDVTKTEILIYNDITPNIPPNITPNITPNINTNITTKTIRCKYCKRIFNTRQSKSRHELYYCKEKPEFEENKTLMKNLVDKLSLQVKELMEEKNLGTIDLSSMYGTKQIANEINNTQQINTQNNQMVNNIDNSKQVNINNYGEEDISHITDLQFKEMLEDPFSAMSSLINAIHFNDLKPENQNLRIPNIKQPFIEIFKDGEWVVGNQYKLLCKIYTVKREILHQAFLRIENQLDEKTKQLYYEFRRVTECDLFTVQSQLTDIKAVIISGTRHKPPVPSRQALRQTCCPPGSNKNLLKDIK